MMDTLFIKLADLLSAGCPAVLCRIVASDGSVPRGAGAAMLVWTGGFLGTIGGGALEQEAIRQAGALLESGRSESASYGLSAGEIGDIGMICGGNVQLFYQCFDPVRHRELAAALAAARSGLFLTQLGEPWLGGIWDGENGLRYWPQPWTGPLPPAAGLTGSLYAQPIGREERLILVGAGHVGLALASIVPGLDFRLVVMDSRPHILTPERLPMADELVLGAYETFAEKIQVGPHDYVVIMTPGHQGDYTVLRQVLRTPASYIGCIGSRRKVAATREKLLAEGFAQADLDRIHAPIGLPIGAVTPEEIAVSVAAELIAHRRLGAQESKRSW